MCGGGGTVEDNSDEVARIQADEAAAIRAEEARKEAQAQQQFARALQQATQLGRGSAEDYFIQYGLDPTQYQGAIEQAITQQRALVPSMDSAPASYFQGIGQQVYDREQDLARIRAEDQVDNIAPINFADKLVSSRADDPFIEEYLAKQFGEAQGYGQNLLARGVLNEQGYEAGLASLKDQRATARTTLDDIGSNLIADQRGFLDSLAASAKQEASALDLGDELDLRSYKKKAGSSNKDFFSGLGGQIQSLAGDELFDPSIFLTDGGAAQGAQNMAFDPQAISPGAWSYLTNLNAGNDKKKKKEDDAFVTDLANVF